MNRQTITCKTVNWRTVSDYEGLYEVSDTGLVRGLKRSGILKLRTTKKGYLQLSLSKNGKMKFFRVHRLVAEAFIPNPENKPTIEHWDEDKTNNHVDNLCWATKSEQEQTKPCKGYYWHKAAGKWRARIKIPETGKRKHLGSFEREEDAHAAYIAAKYKYHPFWVKKMEHLERQKAKKKTLIIIKR